MVAGLLLLVHSAAKYQPSFRKHLKANIRGVLFLVSTLSCFLVWSCYWYIFFPGIISWDFYVQWHEMAGKVPYTDWHPVFHSFLIWLVTRLWYSPAAVVLAQGLTLSLLVGYMVIQLERLLAPYWIIFLIILFYALFPLFGFYTVTPMKDVAYSIAILWLTLIVLEIVATDGVVLRKNRFLFSLLLALLFVALCRHNGIVPAVGTSIVLVCCYRSQLKRLAFIIVVAACLLVIYKGPVFKWLDVDLKMKKILTANLPIQHIGAVLSSNGIITDDEERFLSQIIPISYWKHNFSPLSCMPLIFARNKDGKPYLNQNFFQDKNNYNEFFKIWFDILLRNPGIILKYHIDGSELVWRITTDYPVWVIPDEDLVEEDLYSGYKKKSLLLHDRVSPLGQTLIKLLVNPSTGWFLHRGALYWLISLFLISLFVVRTGNYRIMIIASPVLLQVITVVAFPLVQNPRFMYPVTLTAPFFCALFFVRNLVNPHRD